MYLYYIYDLFSIVM